MLFWILGYIVNAQLVDAGETTILGSVTVTRDAELRDALM